MRNLSLFQKLLLSYGALLIPLVTLGYLAMKSSRFAESSLERIYMRQVLPAAELDEMLLNIRDISMRLTGYLAGQYQSAGAQNKIQENKKKIEEHWASYLRQINMDELLDEQRSLVQKMNAAVSQDLARFVNDCSKVLTADNKNDTTDLLETGWPSIQLQLIKPMSRLAEIQRSSIKDVYDMAKEESKHVLALLFATVFIFVLTVALLLRMLIVVTRSLTSAVTEVDDVGAKVRQESAECSTNTDNLSASITRVAASLEETAGSVEELTSIVKTNSKYAQDAARISTQNTEVAELGEKKIISMLDSMNTMVTCSEKIESVVSIIDDIAFQINLLALNAAIEAARAGSAGKGFAVVAEAVRNLAVKSAFSAKEINSLIKDNTRAVHVGMGMAKESREALQRIVISIHDLTEINSKIASASEEQLTGLLQVSTAVNQIDGLSQKNAEISQNLVTSSHSLAQQGQDLQSLVSDLLTLLKGRSPQENESEQPSVDLQLVPTDS